MSRSLVFAAVMLVTAAGAGAVGVLQFADA